MCFIFVGCYWELKVFFSDIKNLVKKIFLLFSGLIVASLILFQVYYYFFDFKNCRNLNQSEISILKEIFEKHLNYEKVGICSGKFAFFTRDDYAVAPNGKIYFPKDYYIEDFSKEGFQKQAWLVHEMAHVKQYENINQLVMWKGLILMLRNSFTDFNPYYYEIEYDKEMKDYNIEQQAEIVSHYFLYTKNMRNFSNKQADWYQIKLQEFLE